MIRFFFIFMFIAAACFCIFGKAFAAPATNNISNEDNMSAAYRIITSQTGWLNTERPLTPEDLKGRIILLDFWTYCCINCMHVIPELQELEEEFGDDLTVIGIHSAKFENEKDTANIRQAILRYKIEHPVVNDFDFSIWQQFGVRAWPTLVLINPDGKIERAYSGEGNGEAIREEIIQLRQKYAGNFRKGGLPIALEEDKTPDAVLSFPGKLAWAENINGTAMLLVSDTNHERILGINPETGKILLEIGSGEAGFKDGNFKNAAFHSPQGIAYHDQTIYVADTLNHAIRKIDLKNQNVSTVAGTGMQGYERRASNDPALKTAMASPWDVTFFPDENHLAIAMAGTHQLWTLDLTKGTVSILAGNGRESIDDGSYPNNSLSQPSGLSVVGDKLYFVDSETSSLRVLENGSITTLIGTGLFDFGYREGTRETALMQHAIGLYADDENVYIADTYNHAIRRYNIKEGKLYNFAGTGSSGHENGNLSAASFFEPNDILHVGGRFYIADTNNNQIRIIEKDKVSNLMVTPMATESTISYSDTLPNTLALATQTIAPDATFMLTLPEGWKINEDAPSYLAIFEKNGNDITFVTEITHQQLSVGKAALGGLSVDKTYLLQGTLYYCRKDGSGSCLVLSPEGEIALQQDGMETLKITVK